VPTIVSHRCRFSFQHILALQIETCARMERMKVTILPYTPARLAELREIFFLPPARQDFPDEKEKQAFFDRWTSYYFEFEPGQIWIAVDERNRMLGYLTGSLDSEKAKPLITPKLASYTLFEDLFARFPAHLHINCHHDARGQGVGSLLIGHFVRECAGRGVHIMTSPGLPNNAFYRRNGFTFELTREFKGKPILFMGKERD
jgi:GNAT superfamily N-acetyltransferase